MSEPETKPEAPRPMTASEVAVYVHHQVIEFLKRWDSEMRFVEIAEGTVKGPSPTARDCEDAAAVHLFALNMVATLIATNNALMRAERKHVAPAGELHHDVREPIRIPGSRLPGEGKGRH